MKKSDKIDELYEIRNEIQRECCNATMTLDRLQVELHPESMYETPNAEECRKRILSAMDALGRLNDQISVLGAKFKEL